MTGAGGYLSTDTLFRGGLLKSLVILVGFKSNASATSVVIAFPNLVTSNRYVSNACRKPGTAFSSSH